MGREVIGYGQNDDEVFAAPLELDDARLRQLRGLVGSGDDIELVNVYPLRGTALALISEWLGRDLKAGVDYFLETSA
jgi:hypothetical protein